MELIQSNHLKDFLDILFKRKRLIIIFFLSTVLTAVIGATFFQKRMFVAHAKILIEAGRGYVSDRSLPVNDPRRTTSGLNLEQQVDMALQVLTDNVLATNVVEKVGPTVIYEALLERDSPELWERVLQTLGIPGPEKKQQVAVLKIAATTLQRNIIVKRTGRMSSIIYVGFQHKNPRIATDVVNTLVSLYFQRHLGLRKKPGLTKFFQEQFDLKKTNLAAAEQNLKDFKEKHGVISSPEGERNFLIEQREKFLAELDETTSKDVELKSEAKQLRYQLANTAKNPDAINALHKKLVELQVKESELSIQFKEDSRTMRNLRAEIEQTRNKLDELGYNKRYGTTALQNQSLYGSIQERLLQTELELNVLKSRRATLQSQLAIYDKQLQKIDRLGIDFHSLEEQLSMVRNSYQLYQTKFEEFRISDALDAEGIANVKVLEPAQIPLGPIPSKTTLIVLLSIFFGGIGSIGLALILELLSGTLTKREDTENYLKRPVLATIPEYISDRNETPHMGRTVAL